MPSRQETIARHRADMARLFRAAGGVADERRHAPVYRVWTLKDLLAHVAAWDRALLRAVDELLAGRRPHFGRTSVFNKRAVDASRKRSYEDVLRSVRAAHEALMTRIEGLTDEQWERGSRYRWGNRTPMTVASLFDYTYKGETHYGGHAGEIERWAAGDTFVCRG